MINKKEALDKLKADPLYRSILSSARNDAERRQVTSVVESIVLDLIESLSPIVLQSLAQPNKEIPVSDLEQQGVVIVEGKD